MSGAPVGNQNAAKSKRLFTAALKRLFAQDPTRADRLAEKLISLAEQGEAWAFKELFDRVDGKAPQPLTGGDDDDNPIKTHSEILIRAVDAASDRPSEEG
jgi:hypothetical protein